MKEIRSSRETRIPEEEIEEEEAAAEEEAEKEPMHGQHHPCE